MKHLLITSMIALGVGCGAAMAQTESAQPSGDTNCAAGTADCQKGGKAGEQAQGKMKSQTEQNAQGQAGAKTNDQAQGKMKSQTEQNAQGQTGSSTEQNAQDNTKLKKNQQAQDKNKVQTDQQAQGKAGTSTQQNAQDKTKVQTDQQAQGKAGTSTQQNAQDKTKVQTDQQAQGKAGTSTQQNAQTNTQTDQGKTASINNVTVEQKTQITQVIHETKVEPVRDVSFDISVGVEVPRHKVRLHRLPSRIVKIVPEYESYDYFVLADGRIVIVDPDSYKIVLILT
jgi:hypothetical protein